MISLRHHLDHRLRPNHYQARLRIQVERLSSLRDLAASDRGTGLGGAISEVLTPGVSASAATALGGHSYFCFKKMASCQRKTSVNTLPTDPEGGLTPR
jgi:hypothetical protein